MTHETKVSILSAIENVQSTAEYEFTGVSSGGNESLEDFLMMQEYGRMRDPMRFLILGGRGSGKTRLFFAFCSKKGFRQIMGPQKTLLGPNGDNAQALCGYDLSGHFPSQEILDQFSNDKDAKAYWVGSLLLILFEYFQKNTPLLESLQPWLDGTEDFPFTNISMLNTPSKWIPTLRDNPEFWEGLLGKIDEYLLQNDKWLFITYDFLDRLTTEYNRLFPYIRTLLSFWFNHSMRWRRLRCKIFLRTDLYESNLLSFMDASKLKNHTIRLEWNTLSLYRLFIKRIANSGSSDTLEYLRLIPNLISEKADADLGYVPTDNKKQIELFVDQIIGHYMGNSPKKGLSYQWIPNHLQDANGSLAPRSFLKCFSIAAAGMLEHPHELDKLTKNSYLLQPSMIQNALVSVSEDRVSELAEEYPWLNTLKRQLSGLTMLVDRDTFLERIEMCAWNDEERKTLPDQSSQGIFYVLQKLGIVFISNDGRVNVPEIYLHGFGMRRKGGLRRNLE